MNIGLLELTAHALAKIQLKNFWFLCFKPDFYKTISVIILLVSKFTIYIFNIESNKLIKEDLGLNNNWHKADRNCLDPDLKLKG